MLSFTEENYLKAIYHLSDGGRQDVSTNSLAEHMQTKPASVSDMIKKLAIKEVINHEKYRGVNISESGRRAALQIIRKHRLWEVFLVEKLDFQWDEVHDIAEQLEHIQSPLLIQRLDRFLDFPRVDPHGDPIPDSEGHLKEVRQVSLEESDIGTWNQVVAVNDSSPQFLKYLDKIGISLGTKVKVIEQIEFDGSLEIELPDHLSVYISNQAAKNLLVTEK